MKRKYTRKVSPEIIQPKSDTVNGVTLKDVLDECKIERPKKYSDLPLSLRKEIDSIIEWRKGLGLFDDSVERKERALRYYIWNLKLKET